MKTNQEETIYGEPIIYKDGETTIIVHPPKITKRKHNADGLKLSGFIERYYRIIRHREPSRREGK
jgi:hypothetical protein